MKKNLFLFLLLMGVVFSASAQNRWGVMGGANLSTSSAKDFKWKAGGYIGGLYDIRLSGSWYIQPQLLFLYEENDSKDKASYRAFYSQYALTLPVLASFKINMDDALALRINAGPYLQYALFGRDRRNYSDESGKNIQTGLGWWHADFGDRFTYGLKAGLSLEGKHWFGTIDCKYSLKKNFVNYEGHGLSLSAGIGYKF